MVDNTEKTETPVIDFEQAKAILNVAYLLAAMDGVICEQEQSQFRALMKQLFGDRYADAEVMTYLEGVSEEARKLISLRAFYADDEELVKAFLAKASPSVAVAAKDSYVLRCAFAIWIGICCSDNDYSKIERLAVKGVQKLVNPSALLKSLKGKKGASIAGAAAVGAVLTGGLGLAAALPIAGLAMFAAGGSGVGGSITDAFLADVEKRVKKIGEVHAKMESATDAAIKQNYKDMYDFEVENFKEFLAAK